MGNNGQKWSYSEPECIKRLSSVEDAIYVIGGKWKLKIVIAIVSGHTRFNELQRTIKGISARVLSNELKDLEQNGLIQRVVHSDKVPVVIEYVKTEYTKTLKNVLDTLGDWGVTHRKKISGK
ncbi:MAG: winged helix-turn-helix transcriptional regulator [Bacteroidia bacterium]